MPGTVSLQRKAVTPFRFSDGTFVPTGNYVSVPQFALMRDDRIYTNGQTFDAYRFLARPSSADAADTAGTMAAAAAAAATTASAATRPRLTQKFTDVSRTFLYWGSTKRPW
jgi:cytochrome P450